jgi:hypothetical protein
MALCANETAHRNACFVCSDQPLGKGTLEEETLPTAPTLLESDVLEVAPQPKPPGSAFGATTQTVCRNTKHL